MDKALSKRVDKLNEQMFADEENEQAPAQPVDYYQEMRSKASKTLSKPVLNGSTQKILFEVAHAVEGLAGPFRKAKDDSERLSAVGDKNRASLMRQQYMTEVFQPTVESLVMMNSPEEILNSTKALKALDEYALVNGGRASGYTASFVKTLHSKDFGGVLPTSDVNVVEGVRRVRELVARDAIRSAIDTAKKLKDRVDRGEFTASTDDYDLLQKVALR